MKVKIIHSEFTRYGRKNYKFFHQLALIGAHQLALIGAIIALFKRNNSTTNKKGVVKMSFSRMLEILQERSKEASRYLAGHLGYINIANTYNLENKLFFKA